MLDSQASQHPAMQDVAPSIIPNEFLSNFCAFLPPALPPAVASKRKVWQVSCGRRTLRVGRGREVRRWRGKERRGEYMRDEERYGSERRKRKRREW